MTRVRIRCIKVNKNSNNLAISYVLRDNQGNTVTVEKEILKEKLKNKEIDIENLILTSDNKIRDVSYGRNDKSRKYDSEENELRINKNKKYFIEQQDKYLAEQLKNNILLKLFSIENINTDIATRITEGQTTQTYIDRLFSELGYNIFDKNIYKKEYPLGNGKRADIVISDGYKNKLLIEVKAIHNNIVRSEYLKQTQEYMRLSNCPLGLLTNGYQYYILFLEIDDSYYEFTYSGKLINLKDSGINYKYDLIWLDRFLRNIMKYTQFDVCKQFIINQFDNIDLFRDITSQLGTMYYDRVDALDKVNKKIVGIFKLYKLYIVLKLASYSEEAIRVDQSLNERSLEENLEALIKVFSTFITRNDRISKLVIKSIINDYKILLDCPGFVSKDYKFNESLLKFKIIMR